MGFIQHEWTYCLSIILNQPIGTYFFPRWACCRPTSGTDRFSLFRTATILCICNLE
uniref:Uncharacterized protein n=1 Tax=Anguilla anguilla TaxID=7936 RepID=A0A0E9Q224_ANGAN